jgi:hypothetical protein
MWSLVCRPFNSGQLIAFFAITFANEIAFRNEKILPGSPSSNPMTP